MQLRGACHCNSLNLVFGTNLTFEQLPVRICTCSFCTCHRAGATSDNQGRVIVTIDKKEHLNQYTFGLKTAEFFLCKQCGVYIAAVLTTPEGISYATSNINVLQESKLFTKESIEMDYSKETALERIARRKANWTPALIGN